MPLSKEEVYQPRKEDFFFGRYNLRKAGVVIPYSQWQMDELMKCREPKTGIYHFFNNYLKTLSFDNSGKVFFNPRPYQTRMIENMINYRFNIFKNPRQSGKTTVTAGVFLYWMNFFPYEVCGVVANGAKIAFEIVSLVEDMYMELPFWMQQGVTTWQSGGFELENGSRILCAATSKSALRGFPIKHLFWDEVAAVNNKLAEEFLASIYPTISSSKESTITLSSTTKGYNHFAKFWFDAINDRSGFIPLEVLWNEIPGRDDNFKKETISKVGEQMWNQEFECAFIGSSDTLISGTKLTQLFHQVPIKTFYEDKLKIYKEPILKYKDKEKGKIIPGHYYALTCDTSEGKKQDYYTISVIDLSTNPYEQVATYRDNECPYQTFTSIVDELVKMYGNDQVLVILENNMGFGKDILDILLYDIGTEATVYMEAGKKDNGVRMTVRSKRLGCAQLKTLIERDQLLITDYDTIGELYKFVRVKNSYEASDEDSHDDMVMGLVNFAYVHSTRFIDDFISSPITFREKILKEHRSQIDSELSAIIVSDGTEEEHGIKEDASEENDKLLMMVST